MIEELIGAFGLGTVSISTNVCLLPLYPGMVSFLAGSVGNERSRRAMAWLGVLVLAGVLSTMLLIGLLFFMLKQTTSAILPVLLPLIYGAVIVFGLLMLAGVNPFARLATVQAPLLRNPYAAAYLYGVLLAPMTLPCTGAYVVNVFALGALSGGVLVNQLLFFTAFGLGFGWPLLLLPILAVPLQRRFTGLLAEHHLLLTRVSGGLLVAIGVFGLVVDWLPNVR